MYPVDRCLHATKKHDDVCRAQHEDVSRGVATKKKQKKKKRSGSQIPVLCQDKDSTMESSGSPTGSHFSLFNRIRWTANFTWHFAMHEKVGHIIIFQSMQANQHHMPRVLVKH